MQNSINKRRYVDHLQNVLWYDNDEEIDIELSLETSFCLIMTLYIYRVMNNHLRQDPHHDILNKF